MTPPNRTPDSADKRNALELAAHATEKAAIAEAEKAAAIRFALGAGASLREVSEVTGIPHVTVKRIADRADQ